MVLQQLLGSTEGLSQLLSESTLRLVLSLTFTMRQQQARGSPQLLALQLSYPPVLGFRH